MERIRGTARWAGLVWALGLWGAQGGAPPAVYVSSKVRPPTLPREFRGVWVASVNNMDWPSRAGLSTEEQQKELREILDRAVELRLNAVILQVRPACDALYASKFEPWSEYLTGRMGQAPQPNYDPLEFAVGEAHRRGLELHAWFNPFRARHNTGKSPVAAGHISRKRPQWVKRYGAMLWLDPGEEAAREYSLGVIMDVVRRYDVDGVHLDDYFYPYREQARSGGWLEFPDDPSWERYRRSGGRLSRGDWRRRNVDQFIERLYRLVKTEKRWVKVGISPFGIWRPGFPAQIKGLDAYEVLYADARRWLREGWLDYCAPQLYWSIDAKEQSYPVLLRWWAEQNVKRRHLWPGNSLNRIGPNRPAGEIVRQLELTRRQRGATGNTLWSIRALRRDSDGIAGLLKSRLYAERALVPASSWLGQETPGRPVLRCLPGPTFRLEWTADRSPGFWLVQLRSNGRWQDALLAGGTRSCELRVVPDVIAVSAVSRTGVAGPAAVMEKAAH